MNTKPIIKIITHFPCNDPEFMSDYESIDVVVDELFVKTYGDHYHDNGMDKAAGFVDAYKFIYKRVGGVKVVYENIADGEEI